MDKIHDTKKHEESAEKVRLNVDQKESTSIDNECYLNIQDKTHYHVSYSEKTHDSMYEEINIDFDEEVPNPIAKYQMPATKTNKNSGLELALGIKAESICSEEQELFSDNSDSSDPNNFVIDLSISSRRNSTEPLDLSVDRNSISYVSANSRLVPGKRSRKLSWDIETEQEFIKQWELSYRDLEKTRNKTPVYETIAKELNYFTSFKLSITSRDVKIKVQNTIRKYRNERKAIFESKGNPSRWLFYDQVHKLIGHLYKDDGLSLAWRQRKRNKCVQGPNSSKKAKLQHDICHINQPEQLGISEEQEEPEVEVHAVENDINQTSGQENLNMPFDKASTSRNSNDLISKSAGAKSKTLKRNVNAEILSDIKNFHVNYNENNNQFERQKLPILKKHIKKNEKPREDILEMCTEGAKNRRMTI